MSASDDTAEPRDDGPAREDLGGIRPAPAGAARLLAGPAGAVLAQPWLDRVLLRVLRSAYFPLSRAWAAADAADGDPEAFWSDLGMARRLDRREQLVAKLAQFERTRAAADAVAVQWHAAFFGPAAGTPAHRSAIEAARIGSAQAFGAMRRSFLFTLGDRRPSVRPMVPSPDEVAGAFDPEHAFAIAPDAFPMVHESRPVRGDVGIDHWLVFESPSRRVGGRAWARVHSPIGVADPPTVILGHGICVEFDQWRGLIDESAALVSRGIRVIRPEAPWHGRRRPKGFFGGERMISAFPLGMLELFSAAIQEWAILARWATSTSRGALAFGGSSLGALTSQLAAVLARDWPEALRPRALYLVTHADQLAEAMLYGPLATLWTDPAAIAARGWTPEALRAALVPLEPLDPPVVPPERIVSVLGERDVITPFPSGKALVQRWGVPADNLFISRRGHFTIPMSLVRDQRPTERFAAILKRL